MKILSTKIDETHSMVVQLGSTVCDIFDVRDGGAAVGPIDLDALKRAIAEIERQYMKLETEARRK
jgi:uncharacterized hydantoinase/oxoprolinase family protein